MLADSIVVAGKYQLIQCVGEGAFGEIFSGICVLTLLALDMDTNKEVAVKIVNG